MTDEATCKYYGEKCKIMVVARPHKKIIFGKKLLAASKHFGN